MKRESNLDKKDHKYYISCKKVKSNTYTQEDKPINKCKKMNIYIYIYIYINYD